jgi:glucokinase
LPLSKTDLKKKLNTRKKVYFENDANCFALGVNSSIKEENLLALTLGTGIGSGLIVNKKLLSNGAPELGHTTIDMNGNKKTVEEYLGRKAFPKDPLKVYDKALKGDKKAKKIFSDYGKILGVAISNFINSFNPGTIVLGGKISKSYKFFKDIMQEEIKKRALFKTKIIKNKIKDAAIIGAAKLCFE